jgi:phthalate 4,5-dioxygenase
MTNGATQNAAAASKFDLLTRVEADAPMGRLMREYWAPVLQAEQLESDGVPVRLRILGENLVAFRGTDGKVCIIDEACPHRGVSMALARNEDCGLRCIMHGWKIDTSGKVVEASNLGPLVNLDRIDTGFRPTLEHSGVIWAWFGDPASPGPPPANVFANLPASHVATLVATLHCNWLQPLETLWDPFHLSWLHRGTIDKVNEDTGNAGGYFANGMPELDYAATDYGFVYTSKSEDGLVQVVPFAMPWYSHHPLEADEQPDTIAFAHVPIDDGNTLIWAFIYNASKPLRDDGAGKALLNSFPKRLEYREGYNRQNSWKQDRAKMKSGESFTGLSAGLGQFGVFVEDYAATESMGPIVNRAKEHLGVTDAIIIRARSMLLNTINVVAKGGRAPGAGEEAREAVPMLSLSR